jgi:hypothetical protein
MESRKGEVFECFGPDVKKVEEAEIESLVKQNLLLSFFLPFCRVGLGLIFGATDSREGQTQGYTFDGLCDLIKEKYNISEEILRKHLERALDILLDIGLFSAKWDRRENGWERVFYNRNEIARRVAPYGDYVKDSIDSIKLLHFLGVLLLGPNKNPSFFSKILKINAYLAHIGDIIDPDHWHINVECGPPIPYSTFWEVLKQISKGKIYDGNIKFYHERKKLGIYGLDEWIEEKVADLKEKYGLEDLKITQCKLRFLLEPAGEPYKQNSHYDFTVNHFLMVPIVNLKFGNLKKKEGEEYPSEIDKISSELAQDLIDKFLGKFTHALQSKSNSNFTFTFNAKCKLLQLKLEDYKEFERSFNNILSRHGGWKSNLKMDLKHLNCWKSFVPETVQRKIETVEDDLKKCIIGGVEKCGLDEKKQNNLLVTLARKGDVLVRHIYELSQEGDSFREILEKFGQNRDNDKQNKNKNDTFHSMSDVEFFLKIENGDFKDVNNLNLVIFDDAIDKGNKLKEVLRKIQEKEAERKIKVKKIDVIAFVANKKEFLQFQTELKKLKVNLRAHKLL